MPKHFLAAMLWDLRVHYESELRTLTEALTVLSEAQDASKSGRLDALREIRGLLQEWQQNNQAVFGLLGQALLLTDPRTPDTAVLDAPP